MKYTTYPGNKPSFAEEMLITRFRSEKVFYVREVSFDGLVNPKTGQPLRYDFYLPQFNLIIEFDGRQFHMSKEVRERDRIKTKFAEDNRIKLYRISGINNIGVFFNSDYWKKQIKKVILHKPKSIKRNRANRNYKRKDEIEQPKKTQQEMWAIVKAHRERNVA